MSNIPSSVRVAGIDYSVNIVPFVDIDGNRNYQGVCRANKCQIEIIDQLTEQRKEEVFVHELTHALFFESELNNDEEGHTEEVVKRISRVLYQVLKDNKLYFGE